MSLRLTLAVVAAGFALSAPPALAASHDYCYWDGSYSSNSAGVLCFASGLNLLTNNHAYLPYQPVNPTIYCGAHASDGSQYASYTSGNPSCDHAYSGANALKADEFVSISATTHGGITW